MATTGRSLGITLFDFLSALNWSDLPEHVADSAKLCMLDLIGVALAGSRTEAGARARTLAKDSCPGTSTVIGGADCSSLERAAFINGIQAHALDMDDGNRFAMGHPGVAVIPAVLAYAESAHSTGRDVLTAIVCGYEVFERVGRAVNPAHFRRGFHTTSTVGTLAAAAATAHLMPERPVAMAVGIAASFASGLMEFLADGASTKLLHAGHASSMGMVAALLAQQGFTGPLSALEGKKGFFNAMSDNADGESLIRGLGDTFGILNTYYKLYASCRHTHAPVDIALEFHRQINDIAQIECIRIDTYSAALAFCGRNIATPLSARMSIPYCTAAALVHGDLGLDRFEPPHICHEQTHCMMNLVEVHLDSEIESWVPEARAARVTIRLKNGQTLTRLAQGAVGEPDNPAPRSRLVDKYRDISRNTLPDDTLRTLEDAILNLDQSTDMAPLVSSLRLAHRPQAGC